MSHSSSQRAAITQFVQFTQAPERTATKILKANNWNVEIAIDAYYQSGSATPSAPAPVNPTTLASLFEEFRQPDDPSDSLQIAGTMGYFEQLGLQLDDPTVIALSKALDSPSMGELTKKGFVDGWTTLGADSLPNQKVKLEELKESMQSDEEFFKGVYLWTFAWARAPGQKALPAENAIEWWKLLLQSRFENHLDLWIRFLTEKWNKSVPKDTWNMLYDFVQYTKEDPKLEKYDEMGSWPSVIDGYVEYYRDLNKA